MARLDFSLGGTPSSGRGRPDGWALRVRTYRGWQKWETFATQAQAEQEWTRIRGRSGGVAFLDRQIVPARLPSWRAPADALHFGHAGDRILVTVDLPPGRAGEEARAAFPPSGLPPFAYRIVEVRGQPFNLPVLVVQDPGERAWELRPAWPDRVELAPAAGRCCTFRVTSISRAP